MSKLPDKIYQLGNPDIPVDIPTVASARTIVAGTETWIAQCFEAKYAKEIVRRYNAHDKLFDALKNVLASLDDAEMACDPHGEPYDDVKLARAAIAAAEGCEE